MSPTVLRQAGFQVRIYPNDHPPAHVHISQAGNEARVSLNPVEIKNNWGFNTREIRKILERVMYFLPLSPGPFPRKRRKGRRASPS
ncbi:MAG: DUF4160 domain-containing protein, partial [Anaerolineae bacterium]|nr:DUF4160 domain-containing protein [Anaerolineae bacterium]